MYDPKSILAHAIHESNTQCGLFSLQTTAAVTRFAPVRRMCRNRLFGLPAVIRRVAASSSNSDQLPSKSGPKPPLIGSINAALRFSQSGLFAKVANLLCTNIEADVVLLIEEQIYESE
ncbi:hypothetical protein [Ruegeria lacuscaerulensis]|uniref:hypothetical protein n=1 Tax=Ruegeria lacuscaerulensis TaxID=55218 RepID=UPI00147B569A|nr:hypothetical protein [Ruegeria lacuscaerulensis]